MQFQNNFPSVSVAESPQTEPINRKGWRTTTGIVSNFRKGPPIARVQNSEQLSALFGNDDTDGAVTINSAMKTGLNDFIVSRPIPSDSPANIGFTLKTEGTPREGFISDVGNKTHGINMLTNYVSNIFTRSDSPSDIKIRKNTFNTEDEGQAEYGDPAFTPYLEGQAIINFQVESFIEGGSVTKTESIDSLQIYNPKVPNQTYRVLEFSSHGKKEASDEFYLIAEIYNEEDAKRLIHPGVTITLTGAEFSDTSAIFEPDVEVMSPAEEYFNDDQDQTAYRFAIKVKLTDASTDITATWLEAVGATSADVTFPTSSKYIVSYTWDPQTSGAAPSWSDDDIFGTFTSGMFPGYGDYQVDGYFLIDSYTEGWQTIEIYNNFLSFDRNNPFQMGLTKPLPLLDLKLYPAENISGEDAIGLIPLKAMTLYDTSDYNLLFDFSDIPSRFSARVEQATAHIGRSFQDESGNEDPLEDGTLVETVVGNLFSQLDEKESTSGIFVDYELNQVFDSSGSPSTVHEVRFLTRSQGDRANKYEIKVVLNGVDNQPDDLIPSDLADEAWEGDSTLGIAYVQVDESSDDFVKARVGAMRSSTVLYDSAGEPLVLVEAVSPGETDLEVSVLNGRKGLFDLVAVDRDAEKYSDVPIVERLSLSNKGASKTSSGVYPATRNSKLIRAYFLPKRYGVPDETMNRLVGENPVRSGANLGTIIPEANNVGNFGVPNISTVAVGESYVTDVKLTGGFDGSKGGVPSNEDYIEAIQRLESEDIVNLISPEVIFKGYTDNPIIAEMIRQANESDTFNGLRTVTFQLPKRLPLKKIKSIVSSDLNNNKVRLVAGHVTLDGSIGLGFNNVPVLGTYIGWKTIRPPHLSPAAISSTEVIRGVVSTDIPTDKAYLEALTKNNIDALYFDRSIQRLRFLNGLTTSTDIEGQYVAVEDVYDEIMMNLSQTLSFVRSQPFSEGLLRRAKGIVDTRLEYLKTQGWIADYRPTKANNSNNPPDQRRRGIMKLEVDIDPLIPADYILLNFIRERTRTLSLQTEV